MGLPGIFLAILVRYTVKEPPRGYSEALKQETPACIQGSRNFYLAQCCAATHHCCRCAGVLCRLRLGDLGSNIFGAIHGMGTGEVGSYLALLIGVGGAMGIYLGGRIADFMAAKRGQQWLPWVVAVSSLITLPMLYLTFMATTPMGAIAAYALPAMLGTLYVAPGFALIQNSTPLEMRSVAAAINLFITNIIGLGLGPFTVGFFSDVFSSTHGEDGLRWGLATTILILLWGVFITGVAASRSSGRKASMCWLTRFLSVLVLVVLVCVLPVRAETNSIDPRDVAARFWMRSTLGTQKRWMPCCLTMPRVMMCVTTRVGTGCAI